MHLLLILIIIIIMEKLLRDGKINPTPSKMKLHILEIIYAGIINK
jgi:hypothetical protein